MRFRITGYLVVVLLFVNYSFLGAQALKQLRYTGNFSNKPLSEAIREIDDSWPVSFSFSEALLANKNVNCDFFEADWPTIAKCLFLDHDIVFEELEGGYIILKSKPVATFNEASFCARLLDENGKSIPFVTVRFPANAQLFAADQYGNWEGKLSGKSTDSLAFSFLGYRTLKVALGDFPEKGCADLYLQPISIELSSITVIEYLTDGINTSFNGLPVIVKPNSIPALPGYAENEVFRAIELLPGINSPDETASGLQIRGGGQDQNLTLWDGIPIYGQGHYFGMISPFSPSLVDKIKVWRGAMDAAYGGRLSGIVDLQTDQDLATTISGGAGLNFTHLHGYLKMPVAAKKSDLQVSYRQNIKPLLYSPTYNSYQRQVFQNTVLGQYLNLSPSAIDSVYNEKKIFRLNEFNGRFLWKPTVSSQLKLSAFHQKDFFNFSSEDDFDIEYNDNVSEQNLGIGLSFTNTSKRHRQLSLQTSYSYLDYNTLTAAKQVADSSQEFRPLINVEKKNIIKDFTIKVDYIIPQFNERDKIKTGLQQQFQQLSLEYANIDSIDIIRVGSSDNFQLASILSAYGTYQYQSNGKFQASLGLRIQYFQQIDRFFPEPRLTASYQLNQSVLLKLAYGENNQFINQSIDFDQASNVPERPLWVIAERGEIDVPHAREFSLGFSHRKKGWLLDIDAYFKKIERLSSLTLQSNNLINDLDNDFVTEGSSKAIGVDVLIKKRWSNFKSWIIYTLSKTELFFPEVKKDWFPAFNDQRHQFRWVNTFTKGNWLFSLGGKVNTGSRFTPINDSTPLNPYMIYGEINSKKLITYHRLDLSAFYHFKPAKYQKLNFKFGLSLLNLYSNKNVLKRNFFLLEDPQSGDYSIEQINRNGLRFTPNISMKVSWE